MFKFWPFPLLRNNSTSAALTELFLMFAESKELKVVQKDSYHTSLSCEYGEMTFWSANAYYAWASTGSYKANGCVGGELWNGEMPSRYAVRKLVKAMRAKKFALPVPSTEKEAA